MGDKKKKSSDPRFPLGDPKFQPLKKKLKPKVDERFKEIFSDKDFHTTAPTDAFGRPHQKKDKYIKKLLRNKSDDEDSDSTDDGRFVWDAVSSSTSSDEDVPKYQEESEAEDDAPLIDPTRRFAILGLDWKNTQAVDIFVLCSSLLIDQENNPKAILAKSIEGLERVSIYPSDFGLEKMKIEEERGPTIDDVDEETQNLLIKKYQREVSKYFFAVVECTSTEIAAKLMDGLHTTDADFASDFMHLRYIPDELTNFPHSATSTATEIPKRYEAPPPIHSAERYSKAILDWDETVESRVKLFSKTITQEEMEDIDLQDYLATSSDDDEGTEQPYEVVLPDFAKKAAEQLKKKEEAEFAVLTEDNVDAYRKALLGEAADRDSADEIEFTIRPQLKKTADKLSQAASGDVPSVWESRLDKLAERRRQRRSEKLEETDEEDGKVDVFGKKKFKKKFPLVGERIEADASDSHDDRHEEENLKIILSDAEEDSVEEPKGSKKESMRQRRKKALKLHKQKKLASGTEVDAADPRFAPAVDDPDFAIDPTSRHFTDTPAARKLIQERRKLRKHQKS